MMLAAFWRCENCSRISAQKITKEIYVKICGQSTVGKKMAAVHFTTMPCEPNIAYKAQEKPIFNNICPCTKEIE